MPCVSIIVATHNRPDTLAEALESVQAQIFKDFEIIVISNGETPQNAAQSQKLAALAGARWISLPDGNVAIARNAGVAAAAGEWIAFLDDDDIWLPEKLERQFAAAARTGADMIVCGSIEFHADGRESLRKWPLPRGWTHLKAICHQKWTALPSAVLVRKAAIHAAGGFDPKLRLCEDADLWRRIAWRHSIFEMEEPLARYRKHPGAASHNRHAMGRYDRRYCMKMIFDTPQEMRHAIPSPLTMARRLILRSLTPAWLRHPRKTWTALKAQAWTKGPGKGKNRNRPAL